MEFEHNNKSKMIGQVFTPQFIVDEMLDYCHYEGDSILGKHVIDNSCGDGAFLKAVVKRYCDESTRAGRSADQLKNDLQLYIHGIDTDTDAYHNCIANLSEIAARYGVFDVRWDLYNQSSLAMHKFDGMMDFVIGNPPYVRVHNLDESYDEVKQYKFANGGMTDLYLAFFELGFNMLSPSGILCYITPSSWLNSVAAENMRKYIIQKKNLVSLTDLGHFQAFENATTYTLISLFSNNRSDNHFDYYVFDGETHHRKFIDNLSLDDSYIDTYFYLSDTPHLKTLKEIKTKVSKRYVEVKNGFATLADKVFIGKDIPDSRFTIRVLKASTGKWYKCLYPYDEKGKLIPREKIFSDPVVANHFESHKDALLKGKPEYPTYYEFGRTQALLDVWRNKIAINTIIRTEKDLKIEAVKAGEGLYSGLYILVNKEEDIPFDEIRNILVTSDFANYIRLLKKYKSGGYYTYNTKDVQQYLNYCLTYRK
jgi:adenine-specific DNA-methyltransferase